MKELKGDVLSPAWAAAVPHARPLYRRGRGQHRQRRQLRAGQAQVLRPLQSGRRDHQPARRGALLRRQHGKILEDFRRAAGALPPGAPLPPRPPARARSPTPRPSSGSTAPAPGSKKGEPIDKLLYDGYSTISLGYAGLYECVKYMTGKSHTDPAATPFALSHHAADERQVQGVERLPRTSTTPSTARRWSPPPTSLPSACKSASASSRA